LNNRIKEKLREESRVDKIERRKLMKEYKSPNTTKERRRELGVILGFIKLRDILGVNLPIRVCKHCGLKAKTQSELFDFHGNSLICKRCYLVLKSNPNAKIVGPFSLLKEKPQVCNKCHGTTDTTKFSSKKHKVCDICLGKAQSILGEITNRGIQQTKGIPVIINGTTYASISIASKALGLNYSTLRAYALGLIPTPTQLTINIKGPLHV